MPLHDALLLAWGIPTLILTIVALISLHREDH
jgi:hypothetical protein